MIKLDITTRNFEADGKLRDYLQRKIGELDRYLPRGVRKATSAQVVLEDDANGREDNHCVCEVIMTLPGGKLVCREGTLNMYAAIDIVEAKLKAQIRTYKEKHTAKPRRAKLISRLLGQTTAETSEVGATESSA